MPVPEGGSNITKPWRSLKTRVKSSGKTNGEVLNGALSLVSGSAQFDSRKSGTLYSSELRV